MGKIKNKLKWANTLDEMFGDKNKSSMELRRKAKDKEMKEARKRNHQQNREGRIG